MSVAEKAGPSAPGGSTRHAKTVLISVIGLHLVAETALTPFLPQLFERLYGIEDPEATGLYIWICRIAGLAALPLWGLAARRWPLHKLVLAGLCGSAVLDLLLGLAPSYAAYTVLSTLIVATNSALLLAYPAFIAEHGDESEGVQGRLSAICSLVIVFHLSVVVSTMVGAGVLALPEPRIGISAFAVLDTLLAVLTYRILGRRPDLKAEGSAVDDDVQDTDGTSDAVRAETVAAARGARSASRLPWFMMLAYAALIGVAFDFSVNVARPFFTEFADSLGSGSVGSAVLFFLPSVSALAVLPAVRRCHDLLGDRLLPLALAVGTAGLAWTWLADSLPGLVGSRLLYGIGLGLGQVAVELRMFRATGTKGPAFTAVETARSAGLLAAPLAATAAVSHDLALPLAVAAAVQVCAVVLALKRTRSEAAPASAASGSVGPEAGAAEPAIPRQAGPVSAAPESDDGPTPALTAPASHGSPAYSEENHR
ncbi:MFS transporter [Streptomyces sp. NPDC004647]|uniref:MFS transporter n=1 Tax=Streptomyces sp. NPDC004647 TaxID=3154671 RepID=UPI0033ADD0AA